MAPHVSHRRRWHKFHRCEVCHGEETPGTPVLPGGLAALPPLTATVANPRQVRVGDMQTNERLDLHNFHK